MATLHTRRTVTLLRDESGVLAEVADDSVNAHRALAGDEPRLLSWREWEVELVDGSPGLLKATDELLAEAGANVAAAQSKLGRVLARRDPGHSRRQAPTKSKPVARVLHAYLTAQVEQVLAADRAVRRREPEGIHDLRVALRRLRTSLATYRPLVDREVTDPLRDEMRWVSHALGTARDAEVVRERLHDLLDDEVPSAALRSARSVLAAAGRADARGARRVADETLASERYLAVIEALQHLVATPAVDRAGSAQGRLGAAAAGRQGRRPDAQAGASRWTAGDAGGAHRAAARGAQGGQATALRLRGGAARCWARG